MRNTCIYRVAKPSTFRLSSTSLLPKTVTFEGKRKKKGWGGNLQNIEKSVRKIYIPDPGMIFVQVDQSGAEALIVAYCCIDGQYRQLFKNGIKPHSYLAMSLFKDVWPRKMLEHGLISSAENFNINELIGTPIAQLNQHPHWKNLGNLIKQSDDWPLTERYYYLAKQTEHSSNYDIQPPMFRMNVLEKSGGKIVISKEDSERFLQTKHGLFPEIKGSFHRYVARCAEETRMLYNLHGHPYFITEYEITEKTLKELYAWIPQSSVGEITNIAYTRMDNYMQICNGVSVKPLHEEVEKALDIYGSGKFVCDLLANTHDSYLAQVVEHSAKRCVDVMSHFINQRLVSPIDGTVFYMKSEAAVGMNWSPAKKDNPNGLVTL